MKYKRFLAVAAVCVSLIFTSCSENSMITVISREDGSGTRSSFSSAIGAGKFSDDGTFYDTTTELSEVTHSTAVMLASVADDKNAIGYVSIGSYSDIVKAVSVDGYYPNAENIKNGSYKITRSFSIIIPSGGSSEAAEDFILFIKSRQGQDIVESKGYVSIGDSGEYVKSGMTGKISIAGSSSVTPVMEALAEAYEEVNYETETEIQQSDSSSGISSVMSGICDIGMTSRELSESEEKSGIVSLDIARDGIAVIVNKENERNNFTAEELRNIFLGKITDWDMLVQDNPLGELN